MRLAIGRISDGESEYAEKICQFVRDIYRELTLLVPIMDDNFEMKKKMETMLQSLVKIENGSMLFFFQYNFIGLLVIFTTYINFFEHLFLFSIGFCYILQIEYVE